jgi:hypothetical protein
MLTRFITCAVLCLALLTAIRANAQTDGACPGFESRLTLGSTAQVQPGMTVNLRQSPDEAADVLIVIPANAEIIITGGPVCSGDVTYWTGVYEGRNGWAAEGAGSQRFIDLVMSGTADTSSVTRGIVVLPASGETPWWRKWVIATMIGVASAVIAWCAITLRHRVVRPE